MPITLSRRRVLSSIGLAGATVLAVPRVLAAEARRETTTVRFAKIPVICFAPQYVCEDLLRMEGFTDIRYVDTKTSSFGQGLAEGKYDFASNVTAQNVVFVDSSLPITLVAGIHAGCYELFPSDGICNIRDLKGKRVGTIAATDLLEMMAAFVDLDPKKDLTIIDDPEAKPLEQFIQGSLYGAAAGAAAAACARLWRGHRADGHRSAVVAIFLLHAGRPARLRG